MDRGHDVAVVQAWLPLPSPTPPPLCSTTSVPNSPMTVAPLVTYEAVNGSADVDEDGLSLPSSSSPQRVRYCSVLPFVVLSSILVWCAAAASWLLVRRALGLSSLGCLDLQPPPQSQAQVRSDAGAGEAAAEGQADRQRPSPQLYAQFHPHWPRLLRAGDRDVLTRAYRSLPSEECGVLTGREVGSWSLSPELELRFHVHGCRMRRPTANQANRCLRDQSLVFVGDSLTRYQYLSLIGFLHSGLWPEPLGGLPDMPNPVMEMEHGNWTAFYASSTTQYGGREVCTCVRDASDGYERRRFHSPDHHLTLRLFYYVLAESVEKGAGGGARGGAAAQQPQRLQLQRKAR